MVSQNLNFGKLMTSQNWTLVYTLPTLGRLTKISRKNHSQFFKHEVVVRVLDEFMGFYVSSDTRSYNSSMAGNIFVSLARLNASLATRTTCRRADGSEYDGSDRQKFYMIFFSEFPRNVVEKLTQQIVAFNQSWYQEKLTIFSMSIFALRNPASLNL